MKTDYNKLTQFEAASIFVAVIGIGLIGFEVFYSMPTSVQTEFADAVQILDMHSQMAEVGKGISSSVEFVMNTSNEFMDEFQVAFAQTFSYPNEIGAPVIRIASAVSDYSASVAVNYQHNVSVAAAQQKTFVSSAFTSMPSHSQFDATTTHPRVAGASIDVGDEESYMQQMEPVKKTNRFYAPAFLEKYFNY